MFGYRYLGYLGNQGKFFQCTPHFISQIKKLQMATILNLVSEFPILDCQFFKPKTDCNMIFGNGLLDGKYVQFLWKEKYLSYISRMIS